MYEKLNTISDCINFLVSSTNDIEESDFKDGYLQAISDLRLYLADEQQRSEYENLENEYLMDLHPEFAEMF